MLLSCLLFTGMTIVVKVMPTGLPIFEMVFFRQLISFAIVFPLAWRKRPDFFPATGKSILFMRGLAGFVGLACFFFTIRQLPLAAANMFVQLAPLFVLILSVIFLQEKIRAQIWLWFFLAFLGLCLVLGIDFGTGSMHWPWLPVIVGTLGSCFSAGAYLAVRAATARFSNSLILTYFSVTGAVLAVPPMLWYGYRVPSAAQWAGLFGIGVFATLAQLAMTEAYRHARASRVAPMGLMSVVVSSIVGWLTFQEVLNTAQWVGLGLIVLGVSEVAAQGSKKTK